MTKLEKIVNNISLDKDIAKRLKSYEYYTASSFINDANRYIKAINEHRALCNIVSVSNSGMSRRMKFLECVKHKGVNYYSYQNFHMLFKTLGHTFKGESFSVSGCGMDMVFHTNYSIMRKLFRLGIINKKQCDKLAQQTPTVI